MSDLRITRIGGPTVLLEIDGWTILTDPTFDPPGRTYPFGWGTSSRKLTGPAIDVADLPPIDAVLISHDQHGDNLDDAGRALLPSAGVVVTTHTAASRLGVAGARGLRPWEVTVLEKVGADPIEVTATPCRHGPPLSRPLAGAVIGFALRSPSRPGVVWITGDTVMYGGAREAADRLDVDVAIMHLGVVRFPITGPVTYSMSVGGALELCQRMQPRVAIPVHYDGWAHFSEGEEAVRSAVSAASPEVRERFRILDAGEPIVLRSPIGDRLRSDERGLQRWRARR
jgi:L-ascorbate metabolism protein UlaG (beta-lactamase superfamily)